MHYFYLAIAILGELFGTTFLKYSEGFTKLYPSIGAIISYILCFYMLAKSLEGLNLSVAYATWCGIGIIAATLLSILLFKESINLVSVIGIVLIVSGVILVNLFGPSH